MSCCSVQTMAMASISTRAPRGSSLTAKQARAGGFSGNDFPVTDHHIINNHYNHHQEGTRTTGSLSLLMVTGYRRIQSGWSRTVDLVDGREVAHFGEEDGGLDDLVEAGARSLEDGAHVAHHLLRLGRNVISLEILRLRMNHASGGGFIKQCCSRQIMVDRDLLFTIEAFVSTIAAALPTYGCYGIFMLMPCCYEMAA